MDLTTSQDNSQAQLSPEQAKAAMGNATFLQDQLLSSQGSQNAQNAPETEETPQGAPSIDPKELVSEIAKSLMPEIQKEIKAGINEAMSGFRKEVKTLLEDDDQQGESDKTTE